LGERSGDVGATGALAKQDHHGVNRYHYAASGCEFGMISVDIMRH
jgi:hypothetical protein